MTARDAAVRRALARVCSPRTMERLVDPILSDMQIEPARPGWRGYVGRRHPIPLGAVAVAAYLGLAFWLEWAFKPWAAVPVVLLAWTPNLVVSAVALALLAGQGERVTAPPASA